MPKCTCKITRHEVIDTIKKEDGAEHPIRRIVVALCEACAVYQSKRNALISGAFRRAQNDAGENEGLTNILFRKYMDEDAKKAGIRP